jgi:ubiquitin-activating enzyme E1
MLKCIEMALKVYTYHFDHNIRDLLEAYPKDCLDSNGLPFWSGPKRAPDPIKFDMNNDLAL